MEREARCRLQKWRCSGATRHRSGTKTKSMKLNCFRLSTNVTTAVVLRAALCLLISASTVAMGVRDSNKGYDADLTLFSPEGRLYQVEYVMRAVGQYGSPAVGVQGEDCCVVACQRDLPDELVYPDSVSNIFRITDDIYSACTGMAGDVRHQVKRARLQALEYKRQYGSPMPSRLLTLAMADAAQVNTQHAAMRPMACVSFVISVDDPAGPLLFRVEPSGQFFQAWGTAAGRGSAASVEFLEETLDNRRKTWPSNGEAVLDRVDLNAENLEEDSVRDDATAGGDNGDAADKDTDASSGHNRSSEKEEGREGTEETGVRLAAREDRTRGGFGVVGEEDTVRFALRALSKASSGKTEAPLNEQNVEIAIASASRGIRVCSRAEVKGFFGKVGCIGT